MQVYGKETSTCSLQHGRGGIGSAKRGQGSISLLADGRFLDRTAVVDAIYWSLISAPLPAQLVPPLPVSSPLLLSLISAIFLRRVTHTSSPIMDTSWLDNLASEIPAVESSCLDPRRHLPSSLYLAAPTNGKGHAVLLSAMAREE